MKRIAIVASGSMGDVRPYGVLAAGFARAGWDAGLVANAGYEALARSVGVSWFAEALTNLDGVIAWQRRQNAQEPGIFDKSVWDAWFAGYPPLVAALRGADVVVSRIPWIGDAARMLGIPFVMAPNLPREGLRPDLPRVPVGAPIGAMVRRRRACARLPGVVAALNVLGHLGVVPERIGLLWHERRSLPALFGLQRRHREALAALGNEAERARLAKPGRPLLELVGLSEQVLPPRPSERFTGIWKGPAAGYTPPPELARLVDHPDKAVFIGYGSVPCMPDGADFAGMSRRVAEAIRIAGIRALIAPGWGGLGWPAEAGPLPEGVVVMDGVAHEWLFPRLGAVVHHCGVGTAMAALAAGIPSVPVPFLQDEPFWAWRLHDLGVAPEPIDPMHLTAAGLAAAIRAALDDQAMRARAAAIGAAMAEEDGIGTTVRMVEEALGMRQVRDAA
ncbi:glycosyltransferase [Roseomonas sp. CECT 9278]|uniref:glycosyltransferase n=1 Tax=Roseomonas sp. CECT 9278 TaxID=2845823 RepID=UPI001E5AD25F|nr:nucleotide disphospho-sugar-binding domain-containing protein [Roseomonas sp. CECT 9278]CAH0310048.1 O-mycaminosyltylonolide 6-deoxyallosyltransferase [Roseomonas sp. CECT 9278]